MDDRAQRIGFLMFAIGLLVGYGLSEFARNELEIIEHNKKVKDFEENAVETGGVCFEIPPYPYKRQYCVTQEVNKTEYMEENNCLLVWDCRGKISEGL